MRKRCCMNDMTNPIRPQESAGRDVLHNNTESSNVSISDETQVRIRKPRRTWKKPPDKPKRPPSSYNLFFQLERERLLAGGGRDTFGEFTEEDIARTVAIQTAVEKPKRKHRKTHGKIGFAELARTIANKWKLMPTDDKQIFEQYADIERAKYLEQVEIWADKKHEEKIKAQSSPSPVTVLAQSFHSYNEDEVLPDFEHHGSSYVLTTKMEYHSDIDRMDDPKQVKFKNEERYSSDDDEYTTTFASNLNRCKTWKTTPSRPAPRKCGINSYRELTNTGGGSKDRWASELKYSQWLVDDGDESNSMEEERLHPGAFRYKLKDVDVMNGWDQHTMNDPIYHPITKKVNDDWVPIVPRVSPSHHRNQRLKYEYPGKNKEFREVAGVEAEFYPRIVSMDPLAISPMDIDSTVLNMEEYDEGMYCARTFSPHRIVAPHDAVTAMTKCHPPNPHPHPGMYGCSDTWGRNDKPMMMTTTTTMMCYPPRLLRHHQQRHLFLTSTPNSYPATTTGESFSVPDQTLSAKNTCSRSYAASFNTGLEEDDTSPSMDSDSGYDLSSSSYSQQQQQQHDWYSF